MNSLLEQFQLVPAAKIQLDGANTDSSDVPVITGPAVFSNLSREHYDAMKGWNASFIKKVLERTLGHAWYEFLRPDREPQPDREEFIKGNMLHTLKLEPELYDQRYVVAPDSLPSRPTEKQLQEPTAKPGTKAHDAWLDAKAREKSWAEWEINVPNDAKVVPGSWHEDASAWSSALDRHSILGPRFSPEFRHLNELTLCYLDPITKAPCKARLDALRILPDRIWIGDLKTAQSGGDPFSRSAGNLAYPVAATFYTDAVFHCRAPLERYLGLVDGALIGMPVEFEWIVIEKTAPYFIQRSLLDHEQVLTCRKVIRRILDSIVAAETANYWPAYSEEAKPLRLPGYWYTAMQSLISDIEAGNR